MKTENLIALLATNVTPVQPHAASRRLAWALAAGLPLSFAWMALEYGVRRDLSTALGWPMFWVKLVFPACIAIAGFVAVQRLARPGVPLKKAWVGVLAPVVCIWLLALVALGAAPAEDRAALVWGQTWRSCMFSIAAISAPVFVAALVALKGLAPTRPAAAGAAAGALAAGAGATVYALHCPELAAPFLAVWYVGGMAMPVVLGAVIGPRLLRW